MKKRILSVFLVIVMMMSLVPGLTLVASAASGNLITSTVTDSTPNNGVSLSKSVTYDPATEKVTTHIEAFTTGTVTQTNVSKPTDIVLVLDVSGSMAYSFDGDRDGSNERLNSLKSTISDFIDATAAQNASITDASQKHSIAIITFASDSRVLAGGFNTVDSTGATRLKNAVSGLRANGATAVDYGLEEAIDLLNARATANNGAYAEREKVVIVFADGDPTHGSGYSTSVAHDAVNEARTLKTAGAKVYSVGIFEDADPEGTDNSNIFMNYVSSNYPRAYGQYGYRIYPGAEPHYSGYYMTASNDDALHGIFETISSQIGRPDVELGASATLIDVVSDYFAIDGGTANPDITVRTADYKGSGTWDTPKNDSAVKADLSADGDTVTVSGFDFDKNYISETAREGFYGSKLVLEIVSTPDYAVIDAANLASGRIPTNDTAAIIDGQSHRVESVSSPVLTANTVTYKVVDSSNRTVATYYRLPGATINLLNKPADNATYTYSGWTTSDVTVSGNSFKMPARDVTLTSTGTLRNYNVNYTYDGNVPAGTSPATAPSAASYAVGANVTHPVVTAPEGYAFSGWTEDGGDIESGVSSFAMPAENLHFRGSFIALPNSYKVEHYLMDTEGNYPAEADHSIVYENVKTGEEVTATVATHTGFTFDESADNVLSGNVQPNGELVLKLYYKRNTYTVSYQYDGNVPAGAAPSAAGLAGLKQENIYYGAEVTVASNAKAPGYTFTGWRVYTGDTAIENGKMIMPDSDVVLHGAFNANANTPYKVEHYFENLNDDGYTIDESKTSNESGKTGTTAYAEPLSGRDIIGFSYDAAKTEELGKVSGEIAGDGSLVLKLYYTRTRHKVSYEYTGAVPADAEPSAAALAAAPYVATYKYGAKVDIADAASAPGYSFVGWNITGSGITVEGNSFTMPARDVVLTGHFDPLPNSYTVKHYLMDTSGNYPTEADHSILYENVKTGDSVTATVATHTGFSFDESADNKLDGEVLPNGELVLKLYYKRNTYTVSYQYDGNVPEDANPAADGLDALRQVNVYYGAEVTVAADATAAGYTFSGWSVYTGDTAIESGTMIMPNSDVILHGAFTADGDTPYIIKHYFENLNDDEYTIDESKTSHKTGKTDTIAYAQPLSGADIVGFSYDPEKTASAGLVSGTIEGKGTLVLKLYYTRTRHEVSYEYTGTVPGDAAPSAAALADAPYVATYKYGAKVDIAAAARASGYSFVGWNITGSGITVESNAFSMPARDVVLTGHFDPLPNSYTVKHYLMDTKGNYPDEADHSILYENVKTGEEVTATVPTHTGFTFDRSAANVLSGTVQPNGELVLKLYFKRNTHTVSYKYDGNVPDGAAPSAAGLAGLKQENIYYGAEVTVASNAAAPGYTFSGWRVYTGDTAIENGKMIMPDSDVVLHGAFNANANTPYKVEHYFENLNDDGYTKDESKTTNETGKTGTTAYAEPLSGRDIIGFSYDPDKTEELGEVSGEIAGDGSLVLKLYYTRTRHKVSYEYTGAVPADADPTAVALTADPYTATYKYGTKVAIADAAKAYGYSFVGWNISGTDITVNDNAFSMPTRDVVLTGHFDPIPSKYTVEHWLEGLDGTYSQPVPATEFTVGIEAHDVVKGVPNTYNTYTYNAELTAANNSGLTVDASGVTGVVQADGSLVLKLYYTRNAYGITYVFENNPGNLPVPTDSNRYKHGTVVKPIAAVENVPAGYVFDGWYYGDTLVGDSLTMPREDVELVGRFAAKTDVPYAVKYYLQNADGKGYTEDKSSSYTATGTTGAYVYGATKEFHGFSFDNTKGAWNGHIKGDGSLVLELYYNRNTYTVSYYYFGTPPTDTTISMDGEALKLQEPSYLVHRETVRYGAAMTVESGLSASDDNYEFRGWYTTNLPNVAASAELAAGTAYTMPAHNVEFEGALYDYTVYYNLDGGTLNGSEDVAPKKVNWSEDNLLPAAKPEKTGMIFIGWTHGDDSGFVSSSDKYSDHAGTPDIDSIVLDANYAEGYMVRYDWGKKHIPDGVTLPTDSRYYAEGDSYTVDKTYAANYTVEVEDADGDVVGVYTFSGWTDPNNGVMGDTSVTIHGSWTYKDVEKPVTPVGVAKLIKVDANDNATVLHGVVFDLYSANGTLVGSYTTDTNGVIEVANLLPGDYYWVESRPAEGYVLDDTKHSFTVAEWTTTTLTIENEKAKVPSVFSEDHYAYVIGYDDGLVHPEANITRAEVATIFFRLLSEDTRNQYLTTENSFSDVNKGNWYNTAVSTMAAMGIITGRPGNFFDPNAFITRAEFAAIAARFEVKGNARSVSFVDIDDHWAKDEINIAANDGWVLGYEDGSFRPDKNITRAEAMTMVNRVLQRLPENVDDLLDDMVVWPDNMDTAKWYYLNVQEATNSHDYERKQSGYEYWTGLREVPDWTKFEK